MHPSRGTSRGAHDGEMSIVGILVVGVVGIAAMLFLSGIFGCSTAYKLYACRNTDSLDYIEALDMKDAVQQFKLAHPDFTKYACKYVDHTGQIGKERGTY